MKSLPALLLLTSTCVFGGEISSADMYCDDTKTIVKTLREDYKEAPIIIGKASDMAGSVMTLWINPETKSWSIIATKDNTSCIIGVGEKFDVLVQDKKSKPIKYY
jgi:hypothetical protein